MHKTKEKVWTMKDEKNNTKDGGINFDWDCSTSRMPLACPIGMVEVLEASSN